MIRGLCTVSAHCSKFYSLRVFSSSLDFAHEKPAPEQLEHVQKRVTETIPLMFRHRLDYTFYRKDVFCENQILQMQVRGLDSLMRHFGIISVMGQFLLPHIEMEAISVVPIIEDGTVRCRWRIKYVSFIRLLFNFRLFKHEYRQKNLSWFDGYSIFTVDGNGHVSKLTIQRTMNDESKLLRESPTDKIKAKIQRVVQPPEPGTVHYAEPRSQKEKEFIEK